MEKKEARKGTKVICNGYEGVIIEVLAGQLDGMVNVRLGSGIACVAVGELIGEEVTV